LTSVSLTTIVDFETGSCTHLKHDTQMYIYIL